MVARQSSRPSPVISRVAILLLIALAAMAASVVVNVITIVVARSGPESTFAGEPNSLQGFVAVVVAWLGPAALLAGGWSLIGLTLRLGQPVTLRRLLGWLGAGLVVLGALVLVGLLPLPGRMLLNIAVALCVVAILGGVGLALAASAGRLNAGAVGPTLGAAVVLFVALLPMLGGGEGYMAVVFVPPLIGLEVALPIMLASRRSSAVRDAWPAGWLVAAAVTLFLGLIAGLYVGFQVSAAR